jgi:hypothetical protein
MSAQKFTIYERFAFWKAYEEKCIYCKNPILELSSLCIDHVIPEYLAKPEEEVKIKTLLLDLNLPASYDISEYYNLVSSCSKCNAMKSSKTGIIPNPIVLNEANVKATVIAKLVDKYRKKLIANKDTSPTTMPFKFMFRERSVKGPISKSILVDLYDIPVYAGGVSDFSLEGFQNKQPENPPIINTVNEYIDAVTKGWYPDTTFSIKISGWFETARCFLHALENARCPFACHFSDNFFNFTKYEKLSEVFAYPSYVPESELRDYPWSRESSIVNYFNYLSGNNKELSLISNNDEEFVFEADYTKFYIQELLRADFSGNGFEEILCVYGLNAIGGSLGFSNIILLQKESPDKLITFKYYECT